MDRLYYIKLDEQQQGPYKLEQVKNFGLFADTLICVSGEDEEWKPAINFPELADCISTPESDNVENLESIDIFNTNYYYKEDNQLYGPFSLLELVFLDIQEDTLLGVNSTENWHFASEIDGLLNILSGLSDLEREEYKI